MKFWDVMGQTYLTSNPLTTLIYSGRPLWDFIRCMFIACFNYRIGQAVVFLSLAQIKYQEKHAWLRNTQTSLNKSPRFLPKWSKTAFAAEHFTLGGVDVSEIRSLF